MSDAKDVRGSLVTKLKELEVAALAVRERAAIIMRAGGEVSPEEKKVLGTLVRSLRSVESEIAKLDQTLFENGRPITISASRHLFPRTGPRLLFLIKTREDGYDFVCTGVLQGTRIELEAVYDEFSVRRRKSPRAPHDEPEALLLSILRSEFPGWDFELAD